MQGVPQRADDGVRGPTGLPGRHQRRQGRAGGAGERATEGVVDVLAQLGAACFFAASYLFAKRLSQLAPA